LLLVKKIEKLLVVSWFLVHRITVLTHRPYFSVY